MAVKNKKGYSLPYKVYTALLTQNGSNAPTVNVIFENTLGSITFSYISVGQYLVSSDGLFTFDKTVIIFTPGVHRVEGAGTLGYSINDDDTAMLTTKSISENNYADDIIGFTPLEIRVYN